MSLANRLTLVLNCAYEPVNVVQARRAITMVMKGVALVEAASNQSIRTSRMTIPIPSVIRLLVYRRVPRQSRSVSRKGILMRDLHTCQYCLQQFEPKRLTLDHVIPRSKGGLNSWENMTTACVPCNNRKRDRTPQEAGMPLPRKPIPVTIHSKHRSMAGNVNQDWDAYLFA